MKKVTVTVEVTENNYAGHLDDLPGCVSTGKTFREFKENINEAVKDHLELSREYGDQIPTAFQNEYELIFRFDTQSILQHYRGVFTNAALERISGINQRQLQHYASGKTRPRPLQAKKIENALHRLGEELLAVEL